MIGRRTSALGALAMGILFAGCAETGTGPEDGRGFDADAALGDYAALESVLSSSAWESFQAVSSRFSFGAVGSGGTSRAIVGVMSGLESVSPSAGVGAERTLIDRIGAWGTLAVPVISATHRGVTFEWDPVTDDYTASERTGAPTNGVRFILYETDFAGDPVLEAETGYADLVDEGDSATGIALRLSVVENGLRFLDYRVGVASDLAGGLATVDGFLTDGEHRLDFDIRVEGTESDGAVITFDAGIESRGFSVSATVSTVDDGSGETGAVNLTVTHGPHSMVVDMTGSGEEISGTFTLNGEVFATAYGTPDDPTFSDESGGGLTASEVQALDEMLRVSDEIFTFFEDLMAPAAHLILLGLVL